MLPFCYKLFEEIGTLDKMKSSFVRKPGVRFSNSIGDQTTTWCFSRVIPDESFLSFQVVRSDFDLLQLENSRSHGATVCEELGVELVLLDFPRRYRAKSEQSARAEKLRISGRGFL